MPEKKTYPLTQSQKMMFYNMSFSRNKAIVNICTLVEIAPPVEEKLLLHATVLTLLRIPACNMRVCRAEDRSIVQYESEAVPADIEVLDFSEKPPEALDEAMAVWNGTAFPNGGMNTQLYAVRLLRLPEGRFALHFCVSHVVFDAYALMDCVKQIDAVYGALANGTPLPPAPQSPLPAYEADYAYTASAHHAADVEYWRRQFKPEPHFTTLNGKTSREYCKDRHIGKNLHLLRNKAEHLNCRIPKELVARIEAYAACARVSPQCLYLLALRTYLGLICGTDDVMLILSMARRATLAQKRAGGTMVNSVPLRTSISAGESFARACDIIARKQSESFRHGNISCEEVLNLLNHAWGVKVGKGFFSVSTTYQPYFTTDDTTLHFRFRRLPNGFASLPMYISIMPIDDSGDFWVNYEYQCAALKGATVEKYHAFLLAFLDRALADPGAPLGELAQGLW